jgi:hypothetical protein
MEKKQPEIDIYKSLRTNRAITMTSVIVAGIVVVLSVNKSNNFSQMLLDRTFNKIMKIDSKGEVQNMSLVDRSETMNIEISDHLEKWFDRYYEFAFNTVQKKTAHAQWLIAKDDYTILQEQYKEWHKELRQQKYTQTALLLPDSIKITGTKEPYTFRTSTIVTVGNGYAENRYLLTTTGEIILVEPDYPKNPHGFLIRNYKELNNEKIQ